jgi:hypothetical protein
VHEGAVVVEVERRLLLTHLHRTCM